MILAIETATNVCSVVFENAAGKIFEKRSEAKGSHSENLFLFIRTLMEEHQFSVDDLTAVLVSEGPGSYTGLRIAASGVKGLLFGTAVPLYGLQTLASFATAALERNPKTANIHAIIDARRVHVYHQQLNIVHGVMQARDKINIVPIEAFQKMVQPDDVIIGTGLHRLDEALTERVKTYESSHISARSLVQLYHRKEAANFMHQIAAEKFNPQYYSSNQIE